jgi:transcriptional regulator with XRE-family HTH domain
MEKKDLTEGGGEEHVGERIKEIRRELRISQREFAREVEISSSFLSEVEAGKCKPGFGFINRAVLKFKVNPLYLLMGIGEMFLKKGLSEEDMLMPDNDYGEYTGMIKEMLWYFKRSPVVKMAVLEFFKRYIYEHREMIREDIKNDHDLVTESQQPTQ